MEDRFQTQEEADKYIQNAYDRHGHYMVDGKPKYTAHAVRLEEEYGFKNIAGHYKFRDGKTADMAEYGYRKAWLKYSIATELLKKSEDTYAVRAAEKIKPEIPKALNEVNAEIAELTKLNPELGRLNYNKHDFVESYRALIGVTSQYNVDDINTYLHTYRTGVKNVEVQDGMERLKKTHGIRFGWQPAVSTLKEIDRQIVMREKIKAQQAQR